MEPVPLKTAYGYIVLLPNNQLCTRQSIIYLQSYMYYHIIALYNCKIVRNKYLCLMSYVIAKTAYLFIIGLEFKEVFVLNYF
jgi:hypothetical protein